MKIKTLDRLIAVFGRRIVLVGFLAYVVIAAALSKPQDPE